MNDGFLFGLICLAICLPGVVAGVGFAWLMQVRERRALSRHFSNAIAPLLQTYVAKLDERLLVKSSSRAAPAQHIERSVLTGIAEAKRVLEKVGAARESAMQIAEAQLGRWVQRSEQLVVERERAEAPLLRWLQDFQRERSQIVSTEQRSTPAEMPAVDVSALIDQLATTIEAHFEAQKRVLLEVVRTEFEGQTQRQVQRDELQRQENVRWQAGLERLTRERRATELKVLLQAIASFGKSDASVASVRESVSAPGASAPRTSAASVPSVTTQAPGMLHAPIGAPALTDRDVEPPRELTDEELDALPPELPTPDKSRKRILPAPKKPVLRSL